MINCAIVFDHRGRTQKGKEGPLEVRVTVDRRPYYINTCVRVRKEEWKINTIVDRPDAPELNERLAIVLRKVQAEINACIEESREIDVADIRRRLTEAKVKSADNGFLEWIDNEIKTQVIRESTRKHYFTMQGRLIMWGKIRAWKDVTVENIYEWDKWLHTLTSPQSKAQILAKVPAKPLTDIAIYGYHKNLKKLLNVAVTVGQLNANPYERLKGRFGRGEKVNDEYLTVEEVRTLRELKLKRGSHLDTVRNLFLVQCFTGMAYADLMRFDINDYREVDGRWIANSERVKTGTAFIGQLLQPVVDILKIYDWVLPRMSNQKYNTGLHDLQKVAGIKTRMHSHLGRHTFGTLMMSLGVDVQNLQQMMGHSDIKMTLRYAKVLAKDVRKDFEMVEKVIEPNSALGE